jgi:hypothetical protein
MEVSGQFQATTDLLLKKIPSTHSVGSWMDPRACLDAVEKTGIWNSAKNPTSYLL